jgi:Kef-type K+ transport system membrane component KefB
MVKLAFVIGSFLVIFPMLLRWIDAVDNSTAFIFISIGIVVVIIGELNRSRMEELSPFN